MPIRLLRVRYLSWKPSARDPCAVTVEMLSPGVMVNWE